MPYEITAYDSLITPQEVVKYAPVDVHSHGEARADMIITIEERLFRNCFGWDFYLQLLDDKKQYELTTDYVNFRESVNYEVNDYVLYKDELFKVVKATTGTQIPPLRTYFVEAEKFDTPAFDLFWKRYLRRIIAFSVNTDSLMFRAVKDSADGLVQKNNSEYKGVNTKEVATIRKDYKDIIAQMIENAKEYIQSNPSDFALSKFITSTNCENAECQPIRKRHHGFNTNR